MLLCVALYLSFCHCFTETSLQFRCCSIFSNNSASSNSSRSINSSITSSSNCNSNDTLITFSYLCTLCRSKYFYVVHAWSHFCRLAA